MSGYVLDDPIPEATSFAVANEGVEGFVRAAALSLPCDVRINAVSPGLAADSYEQFGRFNPGRLPFSMGTIASAFLRRDGGPARSSGHGDHVAGGQMARQRRPPTG